MAGIKKNHPRMKVGILEAAFRFHWEDPVRFPAEMPEKDNGDLKAGYEMFKGAKPKADAYHPEAALRKDCYHRIAVAVAATVPVVVVAVVEAVVAVMVAVVVLAVVVVG